MDERIMLWCHFTKSDTPHSEKIIEAVTYYYDKHKRKANHILVGVDVSPEEVKELNKPKGLTVEQRISCPTGHYMVRYVRPKRGGSK